MPAPAAIAFVGQHLAPVFHAIRPEELHDERRLRNGVGRRVAQERCHIDILAGPVDAALGEYHGVERPWRRAPAHTAIRQIESLLGNVEEAVIAVRAARDHQRRRKPARAVAQPGLEHSGALFIGLDGAKHLVIARDQPDFHVPDRRRRGQRAHIDMHAVRARKSREPEIGNDKPLRGLGAVVLALSLGVRVPGRLHRFVGRTRRDHIKPGLQVRQQRVDRKRGRNLLVELGDNRHLARPKLLALLVRDLLQLVGLELLLEIAVQHLGREPAVADAVDRGFHELRIDGDDGDALLAGLGQHVVAAQNAHRRRAVADIDGQLDGLLQLVALGRGNAAPDLHLIALAMQKVLHAKLRALRADGCRLLAVDGDIVREIDPALGQRVGELHANARDVRTRCRRYS